VTHGYQIDLKGLDTSDVNPKNVICHPYRKVVEVGKMKMMIGILDGKFVTTKSINSCIFIDFCSTVKMNK